MDASSANLDAVVRRFNNIEKTSTGYKVSCPIHDDADPSLYIDQKDGKILLNCFNGCDSSDILRAVGLTYADLGSPKKQKRTIEATYDYVDEQGTLLYQKVRYSSKGFSQRQPNDSDWIWNLKDVRRVLYRLPELLAGIKNGSTVLVVEGEKDVDRLHSLNLTATTNVEGASDAGKRPKWRKEYSDCFSGAKQVVILPDNDPGGKAHARAIADALAGVVPDVRIIELPGLNDKGDVSDWLDQGHTVAELVELANRAKPEATGDSDPIAVRYKVPSWDDLCASEEEMNKAKLHPRCIVDGYLYADVGTVIAPGGTGKTTLVLMECVRIALGWPLYGLRVESPGPCLIITAEDQREICLARIRRIMDELGLDQAQREHVRHNVPVWDVSGELLRFCELDKNGNIAFTPLTDNICNAFAGKGLSVINIDPSVKFGAGERLVNDNEEALVTAARRIVKGTGACVRYIQHTGKANAREQAFDQYAGRGGSALPDGCRMVAVLHPYKESNEKLNPLPGLTIGPKDHVVVLARPKLSYAPPNLPPIWITRTGFAFQHMVDVNQSKEEKRRANAAQVYRFLEYQLGMSRYYTRKALENEDLMSRNKLRTAVSDLFLDHLIEERELPKNLQQGNKKFYLHPVPTTDPNSPPGDGEIPQDFEEKPGNVDCTKNDQTISPPYREDIGGEYENPSSPPKSSPSLGTRQLSSASSGEIGELDKSESKNPQHGCAISETYESPAVPLPR